MNEPKNPSHTEIMTKWWKIERDAITRPAWIKINYYQIKTKMYFIPEPVGIFVESDWFSGRESADIPPEMP